MRCPHCRRDVPHGAEECPACHLVLARWRRPPPPSAPSPVLTPYQRYAPLLPPVAAWRLAALPAFVCAWRFKDSLPIPQGWADLERWWFPLSALNLAFHEAGHVIFGLLGLRFLTVAGGTVMQLAMPAACVARFLRQGVGGRSGTAFCLAWLGINLVNVSYYAADAQQQAIILITGLSGREGGGHDWGYMLGALGLSAWCVEAGRLIHFAGVALMSVAPAWGALEGVRLLRERGR